METNAIVDALKTVQGWNWANVAGRAAAILLTWVLVWALVRYFSRVLSRLEKQSERMTPRDIRTLDKLLDYVFVIGGLIITLALLGLTHLLYSALTAAGIVGIMIGFAVKDVAANFVSGIFILIDQHFAVGDVIKISEYLGTVTGVSLRTTTINTLDGLVVTIPNSNVATSPVVNYSLLKERRIDLLVSIFSESDIALAQTVIREIIESDERISKDRAPIIYMAGLKDRIVNIQVFCYVDVADLVAVQSDLWQKLVARFQERGIAFAAPIRMTLTANPTDDPGVY